ncbi:MAG: hypothetical protein HND48_07570 [Chloroflexi bacterium]|nr:hypothetical protein [Chloroflexota bacterium]
MGSAPGRSLTPAQYDVHEHPEFADLQDDAMPTNTVIPITALAATWMIVHSKPPGSPNAPHAVLNAKTAAPITSDAAVTWMSVRVSVPLDAGPAASQDEDQYRDLGHYPKRVSER